MKTKENKMKMNTLNTSRRDMEPVLMNAKIKYTRSQLKGAISSIKKILDNGPIDDELRIIMLDIGTMCDKLEKRSNKMVDDCESGICSTSAGIIQ